MRRSGTPPTLPRELRRLRLATAAGDCAAGHGACARVAEVGRFRTAARIGVCHPEDGAFGLFDFLPTFVANENGLTGHGCLLELKFHRNTTRQNSRSFSVQDTGG